MDSQDPFEYVFAWKNTPERAKLFGRRCRILAKGKRLYSVKVEFEDGEKHIVSQRAIKLAK